MSTRHVSAGATQRCRAATSVSSQRLVLRHAHLRFITDALGSTFLFLLVLRGEIEAPSWPAAHGKAKLNSLLQEQGHGAGESAALVLTQDRVQRAGTVLRRLL